MYRFATVGALALALAAIAPAKEFHGIVALASCAEAGKFTEKEHADCAKRVDRDEELLVFVDLAEKKAYDVIDESQIEEFLGKLVVVQGTLDSGFIEIEAIRADTSKK